MFSTKLITSVPSETVYAPDLTDENVVKKKIAYKTYNKSGRVSNV